MWQFPLCYPYTAIRRISQLVFLYSFVLVYSRSLSLFQQVQLIYWNSNRISLCSYVDPQAVIGCEDGKVRVFDMYSRKISQIIKYIPTLLQFLILLTRITIIIVITLVPSFGKTFHDCCSQIIVVGCILGQCHLYVLLTNKWLSVVHLLEVLQYQIFHQINRWLHWEQLVLQVMWHIHSLDDDFFCVYSGISV